MRTSISLRTTQMITNHMHICGALYQYRWNPCLILGHQAWIWNHVNRPLSRRDLCGTLTPVHLITTKSPSDLGNQNGDGNLREAYGGRCEGYGDSLLAKPDFVPQEFRHNEFKWTFHSDFL